MEILDKKPEKNRLSLNAKVGFLSAISLFLCFLQIPGIRKAKRRNLF